MRPTCPLGAATGPRRTTRLESWTFDDGGEEQPVSVPHTWNATDAVDPSVAYERGRKRYYRELGPFEDGRRRLLHFEGANQVTEVRVDGEAVGTHEGGYTAFTFDVPST